MTIIYRKAGKAFEVVGGKITPEVYKMLSLIEGEMSRSEIMNKLGLTMVELMLNKYHFKEEEKPINDLVKSAAYHLFSKTIGKPLTVAFEEKLVKVLAAVYRSIQRRSSGGNSYLKFISQFTGVGYGLTGSRSI